MEDLTHRNPSEETDADTEPSSKKKKDSASVRKIGAFAKMTAETPPKKIDKTTPRTELFAVREKDPEDTTDNKSEKQPSPEHAEEIGESAKILAQKNELLQEELNKRITAYQEVMNTTPADSAEHVQAAAAKNLDENVKAKTVDPNSEADPVIEAEYARQLAEIELPEEADIELREAPETTNAGEETALPEPTPATPVTSPTPNAPHPGAASANPPVPRSTSPPPSTPTPRPASPPPTPQPAFGGDGPRPPLTGNAVPNYNPNAQPVPVANNNERSKRAQSFMAGGILGYMIGRRGGRKRTERRLQPEITKLDTELRATKKQLTNREQDIQAAVRSRALENIAPVEQQIKTPETVPSTPKKPATEVLRQVVYTAPESPYQKVEPAPKTIQKPLPANTVSQKPEAKPQPTLTKEQIRKRTEQLPTPALLKIAESLFVDGTSVKQLYDINRIDRTGLVALVQEGLAGKDLSTTYQQVALGKERQAERAREFRHDDPGLSGMPPVSSTPILPEPIQNKPSQLPNSPDRSTLQPLHAPTALTKNSDLVINKPLEETRNPGATKKTELTIGAISAIAIAILIVWAILS